MSQEELITELKDMCHRFIDMAKSYQKMGTKQLNARPAEGSWSALECFAHMNLYNDHYVSEIKLALESKPDMGEEERRFKSGWFGGRTANSMLPREGKMRKMKTFKQMDPIGSDVEKSEIDAFIKYQRGFLDILRLARSRDINKTKVKLTLPLIKFNAGDSLRFIQNHNARHLAQAKRAMDTARNQKK